MEDPLIGQEMVAVDEKLQSMAASMIGVAKEGRATSSMAAREEGALVVVMDSQLRTPQRPKELQISTPETEV